MKILNFITYALSVVVRDIREAKVIEAESNGGNLKIRLLDDTIVEYKLDDKNFCEKNNSVNVQVLSRDVEGLEFEYYDAEDNKTSDTDNVKRIKITITANDRDNNSPFNINPITFKTSAYIRTKD